jgi:hypothetical protein
MHMAVSSTSKDQAAYGASLVIAGKQQMCAPCKCVGGAAADCQGPERLPLALHWSHMHTGCFALIR